MTWPNPDRASLEAFFGRHELDEAGRPTAAWESANLVTFTPPFRMVLAWDQAQRLSVVKCHRLVADSLKRVFAAVWGHYGTQAAIEAAGLHLWGGCYEFRASRRGGVSLHAWGAGVDWNPAANPLGVSWKPDAGMMPVPVIDAFLAEGWAWGGRFQRPDSMHFEAVSRALPANATRTDVVPHTPASAAAIPPAEPSMSDALKVRPFPEPGDVVNHERAHVYMTLAGQMGAAGYRFGKPLPAGPPPMTVRNAWRAPYAAMLEDGLRQWVTETSVALGGPADATEALQLWKARGLGDPAREVARRMNWFVFEVMEGR